MRRCYEEKKFTPAHLGVIEAVAEQLQGYADDGYTVILRQLYYRLVARDLFTEDRFFLFRTSDSKWTPSERGVSGATVNAPPNYKWLGGLMTDARLAGLVDWDHLEDRNRNTADWHYDSSPAAAIRWAAARFALSRWKDQPRRVEVWVEKDSLSGVVERGCRNDRVPYLACKGYMSQSEMKVTANRYGEYIKAGQPVDVLYLGDHDPSGLNMGEVNERQLRGFLEVDSYEDDWDDVYDSNEDGDGSLTFTRIGLNMDQIREHNPPPNAAKLTDSRAKKYIAQFGRDCWELDALTPEQLVALIEESVSPLVDQEVLQETLELEGEQSELIMEVSNRWGSTVLPAVRAAIREEF